MISLYETQMNSGYDTVDHILLLANSTWSNG